ncbi:hypothetical protein BVX97_02240 [bacterium E08(2017)]|nr:hypothetical protein BVX97_02240 [bacterium E08(2017)]
MNYVKLYLGMLVVFFAVDIAWIGFIAKDFYRKQIGHLFAETPVWAAAILFYLLFVLGVMVFVVLPGLESGNVKATLLKAAFFGLVTYATYDLTNQALVKDWPVIMTVVDMTWGMVLSTAIGFAGLMLGRWIMPA